MAGRAKSSEYITDARWSSCSWRCGMTNTDDALDPSKLPRKWRDAIWRIPCLKCGAINLIQNEEHWLQAKDKTCGCNYVCLEENHDWHFPSEYDYMRYLELVDIRAARIASCITHDLKGAKIEFLGRA